MVKKMCIPTVRTYEKDSIKYEEITISHPVMIQIYYSNIQKCPKCGQQITPKREYKTKEKKVIINTKTKKIEKVITTKMLVFKCPKCGSEIYP